MAGLKYYERTKHLIELIEKKQTGSPKELAEKLQVHERTVCQILEEILLTISDDIGFYVYSLVCTSPNDSLCQ
jgi:arginine repressor